MMQRARQIAEGKEPRGALDGALAAMLTPASALYGAASRVRAGAYAKRWLRSRSLPAPVFCVGNLTLGGSGKTPTAAYVAKRLVAFGRKPAILSRGYGGSLSGPKPEVVSNGRGPVLTPAEGGDEPCLLSEALPGTPVIIGADRVAAGELAIETLGADAIVLDDGFQHLRLRRDFDLVLLDTTRDPAALRPFPRGPLREGFAALRRATAIGLSRADRSGHVEAWRRIARAYAPTRPVFAIAFHPKELTADFGRGEPMEPGSLDGQRVFALSGIVNPADFEATLESMGAEVVGRRFFQDHHAYHPNDLESAAAEALSVGADCLVATEKDAVKCRALGSPLIPCLSLKIEADFGDGAEALDGLLRRALGGGVQPAGRDGIR